MWTGRYAPPNPAGHPWQDWYHPMKLTFYVALLWAVWHWTLPNGLAGARAQCGIVCAGWESVNNARLPFGAAETKPADWLLVWGEECVGLRGVQYGGDVHAGVGDGCADRIEGDQGRHAPHHVSGNRSGDLG
jgi:hypothetical protein